MLICSDNISEEKICPEMELLNQACLDLVEQIEELKKENTWLKQLILLKVEMTQRRRGQRCRVTPSRGFC